MKNLRQTKVTGSMTGVVRIGNLVSMMISAEGKRNLYEVRCESADTYTVTKFDKLDAVASYAVDTWNSTCTCDGWKNGFFCRHLKMVKALEARGVV